ncbi:acyltransferase family protein [Caulobacter sp. NIBR2454]|uniref:acyltransferase family protein n=1 Tax=Caulobacter sp. NIBR2454 TaxID=3015996 RepID=UPI0022B68744|nr:acyltransferase [Caulobacter sp. NIBR2454]
MRLPRLQTESDEFLHLDALRFLAAAGIVFFHLMGELRLPDLGEDMIKRSGPLNLLVDLFFVVSGIVIAHAYAGRLKTPADYGRFLQKRVARLAPLHWLTLLAFLPLQAWLMPGRFAKLDIGCLAPTALFLHAIPNCGGLRFNFPSWSIGAEMMMYVALPAFLILYRRAWSLFLAAALVLVFLYAVGRAGPINRPWWEWTFDWGVMRALPAFMIGLGLYAIRDKLRLLPAPKLLLAATTLAYILGMYFRVPKAILVLVVYACAATALAADLRGKVDGLTRRLAPLGQLTYSLYMWHAFFLLFFVQQLPRRTGIGHDVWIALSAPLLMIVAYVSLFAFERPMRAWISGLPLFPRKTGDAPAPSLVSAADDLPSVHSANYAPGVTPPAEAARAPGSPITAPSAPRSGEAV